MNLKQCKELRRAIIKKFPQFKDYKKLKNSTSQEQEVYRQFRTLYQDAKRQYKATPTNQRSLVSIT